MGGRYAPLNGISQQIISFLSFSPTYFFIYNYITGCISIIILLKIIRNIADDFWYIPILIIFLPGFSLTYFSFFAGEPTLILFWCILLLLLYNIFLENTFKSKISFFIILFATNIALYHKEPGFIFLIVFSVSYLFGYFLCNKMGRNVGKIGFYKVLVLMAFVSSSIAFLIQYIIISLGSFKTGYLIYLTPDWSLTGKLYYTFKALILYIISDPIISVILPVLFVLSYYLRKKITLSSDSLYHNQLYLFCTCLSLSVISYLCFFLFLGIYAPHYLLPTYPFALISLAYYLKILVPFIKKNFSRFYTLIPLSLTAILLINSLFSSINLAVNQKVSSYNFMRYKDALIKEINNLNLTKNNRINLFIPGEKDIGISAYRHKYILKFYDVDTNNISFVHNSTNKNWIMKNSASNAVELVKKGDLILITPNTNISQEKIMKNLSDLKFRKIIKTQSPNYFELPEIRHFLKYVMLKQNPESLRHQIIYREVDFGIYEIL